MDRYPPQFNVKGRLPSGNRPHVAIIGSRRPTPYGEAVAERLAADLAEVGVVIVSGLALGIDSAAHRGALAAGGTTIAVMGTGVDVVYPAANTDLAARIVAGGGALISHFPNGIPPRRQNFPQRNHAIAAISDGVVVVEAVEGSGSLITVEAARRLSKVVMAVPGSVFSPLSTACHELIAKGDARLVQNHRSVLTALTAA